MSHAVWESWDADEYFRCYCGAGVLADDRLILRRLTADLRHTQRMFPLALEYGCGPILWRAIAAAPYVEVLDMADFLEDNLSYVRSWADGEATAHDWSAFTRYILQCEGTAQPASGQILAREQLTRSAIRAICASDARQRCPLGAERNASYDLVITTFCVDCISHSRATWRQCMANVLSMLKPGGTLWLGALDNTNAYRVADKWFPATRINSSELSKVLVENGFNESDVVVYEGSLAEHAVLGYEGILLAFGTKAGVVETQASSANR